MSPPKSPAQPSWPRTRRSTRTRRANTTPVWATGRARPTRSRRPIPSSARAPSPRCNGSDKAGSGGPRDRQQQDRSGPLDRVRVDSTDQRADDQSGRAGRATTRTRSRPACAGRRCSKTSSCARRSRTSTTSASPSASCTRAARPRTASSSATSRSSAYTRASLFAEAGKQTPVFVRFSTVARRARIDRYRARRARLRGEVLHRRRQLGSGRQQHPDLLHPGRDEVSRPGARRQAGAALRHAAGGHRARHVLGLRVADAGDHRTC